MSGMFRNTVGRAELASAGGAALVGYMGAGAGEQKSDLGQMSSEELSLFRFLTPSQIAIAKSGSLSVDLAFALQAAVIEAWKTGRKLKAPAGTYLVGTSVDIPPSGGYEYRADSFSLIGDGASNGFLSYTLGHGTTFITNTDAPILRYTNYSANGNNLHIEKIRFQQMNPAAAQPVLHFDIFMGKSKIKDCGVYQAGVGDGIKIIRGYDGAIEDTIVMNRDMVSLPGVRVGTGVNVSSGAGSGGLMRFVGVSSRGFHDAYSIGSASNSNISTRFEQCESSTTTNGIYVAPGVRKTVIENCYFEGVNGTCVDDRGNGTTVRDCFFFEGYAKGIDSTSVSNFGSVYENNEFNLNTANCTAIDVYSDGDAAGHRKTLDSNFFYFLGSGGTLQNVVGVRLTGNNPAIDVVKSTFRPRREWVGGAGTVKVLDLTTGYNSGTTPLTDSLEEVSYMSNAAWGFVPSARVLTEADVVAGNLKLTVSSWNTINATTPVNITSLEGIGRPNRLFMLVNMNANATLVKGPRMIMGSNMSGYGSILFNLREIAGVTYAYEVTRTMY